MSAISQRPGPRPLLSAGAFLALLGGAAALLLLLLPLARERLSKAQSAAPSSLSINYLELSLASRPDDLQLRRDLIRKLITAGQLDRARELLEPLLKAGSAAELEARLTLLDLDRAAWAAVAPQAVDERARALSFVRKDAAALEALPLSEPQQTQLAKLYLEIDQPAAAARLFDQLARTAGPGAEQRVQLADAAWLAAGSARAAAELQAYAAAQGGAHALAHARLAIERMQGAGDGDASAALIERMRALFPDDLGLLELAAQIAEGQSVKRAYELASELTRRAPAQANYHRLLARLSEATGHQLRALDEYVWLVRHGGNAADRERAIALAKANWDLPLLRELTRKSAPPSHTIHSMAPRRRYGLRRCQAASRPSERSSQASQLRALRDDLALDEALGDHAAVLRKLEYALSGELGALAELWQRKFDLEYALGDRAAALQTATAMAQRFGHGKTASERIAGLRLELGDTRGALQTLRCAQLAPEHKDAPYWMRIAGLAFEAGDIAAEREAYQALISLPGAALWQYQRLWELAPDRASALQIASAAFERFESEAMFYAALSIYRGDGDEDAQLAWLARAEQVAGMRARADYWQARISLRQARTARALQAGRYALARLELERASSLLARARRRTRFSPEQAAQLQDAQSAQTLTLGLDSDDKALIAAGYSARQSRLSARERVYILQKLGRDAEALVLARQNLARPELSQRDRDVLLLDARALSEGRQQYVRVSGDGLQMDGLATWTSVASLQYAGRAAGLRGEASYTQMQPRASQSPVLAQQVRELSASLQGRLARLAVEVGVRARDESNLRPFGTAALQLAGERDNGTSLRLHVNTNATDTARERAWGARDALELTTALPFGKVFYVSARGLAEAYYTRLTREYIGAGLSLDAGAGVSVQLPAKLGAAGFRLTGRVAPRFTKRDPPSAAPGLSGPWLPQSSEWAGAGASLGRGKLDAPPLIGREFCYSLDGAAGWLWPQQGVGFSAQAGLGFSLFGADLLTLAARGGNVVGSTVWSANLGYGVSIDR